MFERLSVLTFPRRNFESALVFPRNYLKSVGLQNELLTQRLIEVRDKVKSDSSSCSCGTSENASKTVSQVMWAASASQLLKCDSISTHRFVCLLFTFAAFKVTKGRQHSPPLTYIVIKVVTRDVYCSSDCAIQFCARGDWLPRPTALEAQKPRATALSVGDFPGTFVSLKPRELMINIATFALLNDVNNWLGDGDEILFNETSTQHFHSGRLFFNQFSCD